MTKHLSKIAKLITELCPNGVEFKELGELEDSGLIKLGRGNVISKKDISETLGDYPVYSSSAAGSGEIGRYGKYMFDDERITWSIDGGGRLFYRPASKYSVTNVSGWLKNLDENKINTKYLFFALTDEWVKKIFDYTHKAHPSVIRNEYKIPLPPLAIQEEIVKILNSFTELEAELEANLEARKKQYEHYREKLLAVGDDVNRNTLGEVCSLITKGTTPSSFEKNGISFIKTEAFDGVRINKSKLSYINESTHQNALKRSILQENDILFTIAGATIGKCAIVTSDILPANTNQALAIIRLTEKVNKKYIFHLLQSNSMKNYIKLSVKGSAQPNLNLQQINNFSFPLPPLTEQERIVTILDKFETLVNDISIGLPAELSARRSQYEYYRGKLLTFNEYAK